MRVAFAVLTSTLLGLPAYSQTSGKIYKECLQAADYKGCVQVLTQGAAQPSAEPSALDRLRSSLKVLPSRIENTNLRDFYANTRDFFDSLAMVDESSLKKDSDRELYSGAQRIRRMLEVLQSAWSTRIDKGTYYGSNNFRSYYCRYLKSGVESFNYAAGRTAVIYNGRPEKGLFGGNLGIDKCSPQEYQMIAVINSDIAQILIDPAVVAAQKEKERKEAELAKMAAWERHLATNPSLKVWAEANPAAAKAARAKWEAENAKKEAESAKKQAGGNLWGPPL
jgi:hypothetical protein